ncbi:MAG: tripeptide aminopeptidase PepT [Elusimicrobiaceae bacterium]|nr:tripeptide aminopeptidase PepT [Elusimicrobiaceae bacterium]
MKKLISVLSVLVLLCSVNIAVAKSFNPSAYRAQMIPQFVKYAKIDSMSEDNDAQWMTPGQEEMARVLYEDIKIFGFPTHFSADKYIYVNIPSNLKDHKAPVLGISAHYDTTPDINGRNIQPQVIKKYDGQPIVLKNNHIIDVESNPYLKNMIGKTIVTSDGTTNLGADDKAGVVIVYTLLKTLAENPTIQHGPIDIVITPNEDIGRSAERLELQYYHPDYAFDFDAGVDGEVIVENFTAEKILVTVYGVPGHQSYAASNGYRNALAPASYITNQFALRENLPNYSSGDKGYIEPHHPIYNAKNNSVTTDYRVRYFDRAEGEKWHQRLATAVLEAQLRYDVAVDYKIILQYDNVANGVKTDAKDLTERVFQASKVTPNFKKERAGTTSAMIMAKHGFGGYTVFTGQNNPHSFTEWLSEEDMYNAYVVALNLVRHVAQMEKK